MIATIKPQDKQPPPFQPMGWPLYAIQNAAVQARQQAEAQRQRADRLAARNRRLRATTTASLAIAGTVGVALLGIGVVLGFAIGTGLLRAVGP